MASMEVIIVYRRNYQIHSLPNILLRYQFTIVFAIPCNIPHGLFSSTTHLTTQLCIFKSQLDLAFLSCHSGEKSLALV